MAPTDNKWNMKPDFGKALMLAQREIAVFVCDTVNLKSIAMTLPEVQTLLQGITVGGYRINEQQITLNQGNAWKYLFSSIKQGEFILNAEYACKLHSIVAKEEALEWGAFRSGAVNIGGTEYTPPHYEHLPDLFEKMVSHTQSMDDIYDKAIHVFLEMSKNQFFYGVNERMGRFMMNGILLNEGFPAINLPAKRQSEFNQLMLKFYNSGDMGLMNDFIRTCLDPKAVKIMLEERPHSFKI